MEQTPQLSPTATTLTTTATHYLGLSALSLTNGTQIIKNNQHKGNIWQSISDQLGQLASCCWAVFSDAALPATRMLAVIQLQLSYKEPKLCLSSTTLQEGVEPKSCKCTMQMQMQIRIYTAYTTAYVRNYDPKMHIQYLKLLQHQFWLNRHLFFQ